MKRIPHNSSIHLIMIPDISWAGAHEDWILQNKTILDRLMEDYLGVFCMRDFCIVA